MVCLQYLILERVLVILQFVIGCFDIDDALPYGIDKQVAVASEPDHAIAHSAQIRVRAQLKGFGALQERGLCLPCVPRDGLCSLRIPELTSDIADIL